jgi:hypothetical protein
MQREVAHHVEEMLPGLQLAWDACAMIIGEIMFTPRG